MQSLFMLIYCICVTAFISVAVSEPNSGVDDLRTVQATPRGLPPFVDATFFTKSHVEYGRFLFKSTLLSSDDTVACTSCHDPKRAFGGNVPFSNGVSRTPLPRHTPTLFNQYYAAVYMWDGRARTLPDQAFMPLESIDEMAIDWKVALTRLQEQEETQSYLEAEGKTQLVKMDVANALAAFVLSLVTDTSAFDRYLYLGQKDTISEAAKRGLEIFNNKANCSSCHLVSSDFALFTDNRFHVIGTGIVNGSLRDDGRYTISQQPRDLGAFKTPSLRNIDLTAPYMHDGSMKTLEEVIRFYNDGGKPIKSLDPKIQPLELSDKEVADLIAFLKTLTSEIVSLAPTNN